MAAEGTVRAVMSMLGPISDLWHKLKKNKANKHAPIKKEKRVHLQAKTHIAAWRWAEALALD